MKQLIFMILVTFYGTVGAFRYGPYCGVFVFYFFAVLRPQYCWEWVLPQVQWSLIVGLAPIASLFVSRTAATPAPSGSPPGESKPVRLTAGHYAVLLFGCWVSITFFTIAGANNPACK